MTMDEALRSLSAEHRAAIVRTYYLNESVPEFAHRDGVSEDTVKRSLHDALRALLLAVEDCGLPR